MILTHCTGPKPPFPLTLATAAIDAFCPHTYCSKHYSLCLGRVGTTWNSSYIISIFTEVYSPPKIQSCLITLPVPSSPSSHVSAHALGQTEELIFLKIKDIFDLNCINTTFSRKKSPGNEQAEKRQMVGLSLSVAAEVSVRPKRLSNYGLALQVKISH